MVIKSLLHWGNLGNLVYREPGKVIFYLDALRCLSHINQLTSVRSNSNSVPSKSLLIAQLLTLFRQVVVVQKPLFSHLCSVSFFWSPLRAMFHHSNPFPFPQDHFVLSSCPLPMVKRETQTKKGSWGSQQRPVICASVPTFWPPSHPMLFLQQCNNYLSVCIYIHYLYVSGL